MNQLRDRGVAVIVLAKQPLPGRCKTRLCPPLDPVGAAALAEAALADTLETVAVAGVGRRVLVLEGTPGPWLPSGFEVLEQARGGLGERIAAAFEAVGGPALLIGMDTPQLTAEAIEAAAAELMGEADTVLGPAPDGGYWAIGLRAPDGRAFEGVPMSSALTLAAQRRRLRELGLRWRELEPLRDFDTITDAYEVARLCPDSRFARVLAELTWPRAA